MPYAFRAVEWSDLGDENVTSKDMTSEGGDDMIRIVANNSNPIKRPQTLIPSASGASSCTQE